MSKDKSTIFTLRDLLHYEIQQLLIAEIRLNKTLPEWTGIAGTLQFKVVLQKYHDFVQQHIKRISDFIEKANIKQPASSRVMESFIEEAHEKIAHCANQAEKDAGLLVSIQSINHYKISAYGTLAAFARALDMETSALIFAEAEVNEKQIDDRLTQLAEHDINIRARTPIGLRGV